MEPTYEYKPGQGWIPTLETGTWCLVYRTREHPNWRNACGKGVNYKDLDDTEGHLADALQSFSYEISHYDWEFKIIPYSEGCD
jgi:hypothetical protein